MEHHRDASPGVTEGAPSAGAVDERAREYEAFEEAERRRLERYRQHLTERERRERFPLG